MVGAKSQARAFCPQDKDKAWTNARVTFRAMVEDWRDLVGVSRGAGGAWSRARHSEFNPWDSGEGVRSGWGLACARGRCCGAGRLLLLLGRLVERGMLWLRARRESVEGFDVGGGVWLCVDCVVSLGMRWGCLGETVV